MTHDNITLDRWVADDLLRQRLQERGFTSTRFHDFETAPKSMRFGSLYTEPFSRTFSRPVYKEVRLIAGYPQSGHGYDR